MDEYWEMLTRQMPLVSRDEQEKFRNAAITVIGCGGIGGLAIEMLARMGVGKLVLVDEDSFDLSNLNRQTLSEYANIGGSKSEAAAEKVRKINPHVSVVSWDEHVDESNIDRLIEDSRIVIDALDNVLTRVIVSRKAREYKIPFIHGAVHGTLGQITTFLPNTTSYEEMFNLPSLGKELTDDVVESLKNVTAGPPPVIGPVPNLVSCLEAMEAYKIITGIGKVTVSPKLLTFDLLDLNSFDLVEI
ncbi:HesA/MoeB/ThiF family protein [Methanobrevibacter sp.]|uniref:HesA/MoeB/ThiF family protein n=1 Tax=Methanobrevibacter sp. TaxID=66852 RepID=UPI0025DB5AEF|nr:HesA/MoeB/ThiF family protein [Methanobrevibacter sp.]MBQ2665739.1 HesA/MoeB/ThiF family protein [Methanobrevibacter sp.]